MARRLTLVLALAACGVVAAGPAPAEAGGDYIALGDSVAAPSGSYVDRLFELLRLPANGGLARLHNRAQSGASSSSLRTGGQLEAAIADIDGPSDTEVVTIDIGGNDRLVCGGEQPSWHLASCAFATNFDAILAGLEAALVRDPGREALVAMTYYNPAGGTGTPLERGYALGLLGTDLRLGCAPRGDPRLGLNDRIACIARARGALVADVYPAFSEAGQTLMADSLHPNSAGHAVIAHEFIEALAAQPDEPDRAEPVIRALAVVPRSFDAARRRARVSYRLSEPSVITFRVERIAPGRRPVKLRGSFSNAGRRGANRLSFAGRLRGRRLKPGTYRLVARAEDMAGNVGRTVRAPFEVR